MRTSRMFFESAKKINIRKFEALAHAMEHDEGMDYLTEIEEAYNREYENEMARFWKTLELEEEG